MSIKDSFLKEAKIGAYVELVVGPKEIKGVIASLDDSIVQIKKKDEKLSTVSLDSIVCFEFDETEQSKTKVQQENTNTSRQINNLKNSLINSNNINDSLLSSSKLVVLKNVFSLLETRGVTFFKEVNSPTVRNYMDIAKSDKSPLSARLIQIANSLNYAFYKIHEKRPDDYKIKENIKNLSLLINRNKMKKNKTAASMLGALYSHLKIDDLSLKTYLDGDDNESAFVVAENSNSKEYMDIFACRHLINDRVSNPYILKRLILRIIETDDYSIVLKIDKSNFFQTKLTSNLAFIKAILLANNIKYDSQIDCSDTEDSFNELKNIFIKSHIGSGSKMIDYIPVEECLTFVAAMKAREQGKFSRAEQLYIEAIQNNERPGSAAADLVNLMMQKHDYANAAKYLSLYGLKYMREEAYNNVRSQLISIDYRLEYDISQSEKQEDKTDYYLLAQKAELEEKDFQKSITYYKKAVEKGQSLAESIPNLVSIYNRLEMWDEALKIVDDSGKKIMEERKYLKLRLSVYSSAKNPKYKKDIYETFKKIISLANSKEKRTDLLFSQADLMNLIGEYNDAIEIFTQCLKNIDNKVYRIPERAKRQQLSAFVGLCNAYLKLDDFEKTQEYANKILNIQPDNEFAKSVINGEMVEDLNYIDDSFGVSKISEFILQRINKLSLENELKNEICIQDGVFTGNEEEAERRIKTINNYQIKTSANDEIQSNYFFAIAKIIRQILDRDVGIKQPKRFNERRYQLYVSKGCYFYGNYRLYRTELTHNFDTARHCFLEAISIFKDAKKVDKCWVAATIRYIETFFCNTTDIKNSANIYSLIKGSEEEYEDLILKVMQRAIVSPIEEYVVGMIEMLTINSRIKECVLSNILKNAKESRILDILGDISDERVPDSLTLNQFKKIWEMASKKYYIKRNNFLRIIEETIESVFTIGQLQEKYNIFIESKFHKYLNQTDKEYIEDLKQIFALMLRYNEESKFDYKAERLGRAYEIRKRLEERIADNPTSLSFEKLIPMLTQLQAKIFKESAQLYGNSEPEISVKLSSDCSTDKTNLLIRIPIAFTNKNNVQNADNVSIKIEGDGVEVINDEQLSRWLLEGNGKAKGKIITFKVSPEIISSQVFSVNVFIQYQYKKSMTELQEKSIELPLSIPLYSSSTFEPIENKFEPYRNGSEVKDASMFYGREADINNIIRQISDESGNILRGRCLALYGQTRTGKSSLLYHLEKRLRLIDKERNVIVNIGSIGDESLSGNDITDFLYTLLDELKHEICSKHPKLNEILHKSGIIIEPDKLNDNSEHSQLYFNDVFKKINRCLEDKKYEYNFIVMIDEFTYIYDWIRKGTMTDRIMKFWKAFIQNNNVFAIIIGQDHMMKFVNDKQFTNDFGSTDLRKVTYLPEEDAKKLMCEPIMLINENGEKKNRFQPGALNRLFELTAGSAFLIMNLCAGLVEYLNETKTVYVTRAHIDEYLKLNLSSFEEARFFEPQYDDKSNPDKEDANIANKRILHRIAQLSNKKECTSLSNVVKNDEDRRILESLEQRDVVIINNDGSCKIKVALYKEWIIAKYGLEENNG